MSAPAPSGRPSGTPSAIPAWPFLIGRAKHAGHRVLIVPDFMADPTAASALAEATRTVDLPDGTAQLRELRGLPHGPLSIVYRTPTARARDYDLPGDGELRDETGRVFRLTEGLVLRLPAAAVERIGVTRADLEHVHAAVTPVYRLFWDVEDAFTRQLSGAYQVGTAAGEGAEPLRLVRDEPVTAPATTTAAEAGRLGGGATTVPAAARPPSAYRESELSPAEGHRTRAPLIALAAGVALVIAIVLIVNALGSKHVSSANDTLNGFCTAVDQSSSSTAYSYLSPNLMTKDQFKQEFFSGVAKGATCTSALKGNNATITVTSPGIQPERWAATLSDDSGTWHISSLTQAFGGG